MIDIENEVYSAVEAPVREAYPDIYMTGEYVPSPPSFPCVSLVQMDSVAYEKTQSSDSAENHVQVMYEVNVYSNKTAGKKAECKAITALIDEKMAGIGFYRTLLNPVPNENDSTIYRIVARYKGVVSKDKTVYRR